jgi:propionyl-CoA synthetase
VDNYWSTELGSPITSIALGVGKPAKPKPGAAGFALPGMDVRVVDDEGKELKKGRQGNIVLKAPLCGTAFRTCWKDEAGFQKVILLFPGLMVELFQSVSRQRGLV